MRKDRTWPSADAASVGDVAPVDLSGHVCGLRNDGDQNTLAGSGHRLNARAVYLKSHGAKDDLPDEALVKTFPASNPTTQGHCSETDSSTAFQFLEG
jgi:hypothetical protein